MTVSDDHIYKESGVSGYLSRYRPVMENLLRALEAGEVQGVLCWSFNRLTRDRHYRARLLDLVDDRGVVIISVDGLDTSTPMGSAFADMLGAMGRMEAKNIEMNTRRGKAARAKAGLPSGGGRRRFGFEDDQVTHRPDEAALLREAAQRLKDGEGSTTVTKDWNRRGLTMPGGSPWSPTPLRRILLSPRVAGYRQRLICGRREHGCTKKDEHGDLPGAQHDQWCRHRHGQECIEIVRDDDGRPVKAVWAPIIDPEDWEQLRRVLLDPARQQGGRPTTYLLTSFLRCGDCAHHPRMFGRIKDGKQRYICKGPAHGGCDLSISGEALDHYVSHKALDLLTDERVYRALERAGDDDGRSKQLRVEHELLTQRQRELAGDAANPDIPLSVTAQASATITARLREIEHELLRLQPKRALFRVGLGEVLDAWGAAGLTEDEQRKRRRGLLGLVIDHVLVHAAKPGTSQFDAGRVEVIPVEVLMSDATVARIVATVLAAR